MKKTRFVALFLAISFILATLSACGNIPEDTESRQINEITDSQNDTTLSEDDAETYSNEATACSSENSSNDSASESEEKTETATEESTESTTEERIETAMPSEGLWFASDVNGVCYLASVGNCADLNIVIPEITPDGRIVTGIHVDAFKGCTDIVSISIPKSINEVREFISPEDEEIESVFDEMSADGLSVVYVKEQRFLSGKSEEETDTLVFDPSVFDDCDSLEEIIVDEENQTFKSVDGNLYNKHGNKLLLYARGNKLEKIVIPNGVTEIESYSFRNCTTLEDVKLPDGIVYIGFNAFENCTNLRKINIPDSVEVIEIGAFENCQSLEYNEYDNAYYLGNNKNKFVALIKAKNKSINSCEIYSSTKFIYDDAFRDCKKLEGIIIPDSVTSVGICVFSDCSELKSVKLSDSMEKICMSTFGGCSSLVSIDLPKNICVIEESAFDRCDALTEITFNSTPEVIEYFVNSSNHKRIYFNGTMEDMVNKMPFGSWFGTHGTFELYLNGEVVTEIIIPDDATTLQTSAFSGCTSITRISIPDSITQIQGGLDFPNAYNEDEYAYYLGNDNNPYLILIRVKDTAITTFTLDPNTKFIYHWAFAGCSELSDITFNDYVIEIGMGAFRSCTSLVSVSIPDCVERIGDSAFYGCTLLENVILPEGLQSIPYEAFGNCTGLVSISIPEGIKSICGSAFSYCSSLESVYFPTSLETLELAIFDGCDNLNKIYIQDIEAWLNVNYDFGVELFMGGYDMFLNGELLEDVVIPDSIDEIRIYAFEKCSSIKSVTIFDNVQTIGSYAFANCPNLESIDIHDIIIAIEDRSILEGCPKLYEIEDGVYYIHNWVYDSDETVTSVTIRDDTVGIANYAFSNCYYLENITLPDSVTFIGHSAFYLCSALKSIELPDGVTSIGKGAFKFCVELTSINIPSGIKTIPASAFDSCSSLKNITIPEGVEAIYFEAFSGCESLSSISIPKSVNLIVPGAFRRCFSLEKINVDEENKNYHSDGNCLIETATNTLMLGCKKSIIPTDGSVTVIGNYSFDGCTGITSIVIPDGVTTIGSYAFAGCIELTNITIPTSVTYIDSFALYNCLELSSIIITKNVEYIGYSAFGACYGLETVYYTGKEKDWLRVFIDYGNEDFLSVEIVFNYKSK